MRISICGLLLSFLAVSGIAAGEQLFIPGVIGASSAGRTNLMVQETSGNRANITLNLLDAQGATIASIRKTIEPFQHWRENTFATMMWVRRPSFG